VSRQEPEDRHGLPGPLPAGEAIVWQGRPEWRSLALHAFHVRKVAVYFGLISLAGLAFALGQDKALPEVVASLAWLFILAVAALSLLTLLAWLTARTTVYTLTNRRLAIRHGIALPVTLNVPFAAVGSAALAVYPGGTGDIPLALSTRDRIAYLVLWPHARPWKLARPQPMMRSVPDAARVATILGRGLVTAHQGGELNEPRIVPANDASPAAVNLRSA
jgi:hypothetical protein